MKYRASTAIIVVLIILVVVQFIFYNKRINRLEKQALIESVKTDFLRRFDRKNFTPIDSIYISNDTLLFYRNDSFMGMSVTKTMDFDPAVHSVQ